MALTNAQLTSAVAELRARLDAMERPAPTPPSSDRAKWWLIDALDPSSVAYGGRVSLPGAGDLVWQMEHRADGVLDGDLDAAASVIAALGHPLRLQIIRSLLAGARTLAQLQEIPGSGTSGQLHHHLRELRSAGLVVSRRRNDYAVAPDRVIPILVTIQAALGQGVAGGPESVNSP